MKENARQGFWNGSMPPLGYRLIEAEKRGAKVKKKLDVDPVEAETVRLIFKLYLNGDGKSGALGVKEIVKWLNTRGYRTRRGQTFGVGSIHKLLTNTIYIGRARFNRTSSKTRGKKPDEEIIEISVLAILEPHVFEQVQRQLHARSPKVVAPRVTTGPILLTGLAVCATCGGGMMLRTGTSKGGRVYRYYTCSNCATKGKSVCKGRSIPMDKLDTLVTDHLIERLFKPERLTEILVSLSLRRAEKSENLNGRLIALQREVTDTDEKLKRLYRLVEDGLTDLDEVLKDRLNTLKADRDRAQAALERAKEAFDVSDRYRSCASRTFWTHDARALHHWFYTISEGLHAVACRRHRGRRQPDPNQRQQGRARKSRHCQPKPRAGVFASEY